MRSLLIIVLVMLSTHAVSQSNTDRLSALKDIKRIAFGSCNKQWLPQPAWKELIKSEPELFIWGGDNVYANTNDPAKIKAAYDLQNQQPDYKEFKAKTPMIGTWDDHDFGGMNNGNGKFPDKVTSQGHMLDFLEEPALSPRRFQDGVYTSYQFGKGDKKIKIILIDNRYFKDLDKNAPMLGEKQWEWLEGQFKNSEASLHLVVSGLSILSPKSPGSEEWEDYPGEIKRFDRIIKEHKPKGILFMAGDKHFPSIYSRLGHLEFLSSGMTHTTKPPLRPYVRRVYPNSYFGLNFGIIDIDWENSTPILTMTIRTTEGKDHLKKKYRWDAPLWKEL